MRMGGLTFLISLAGLAVACTTPTEEARSPKAAERLAKELDGRVAGKPVNCIHNERTGNMQVIDDWTILFHEGRTVYVQNPSGGCPGLGNQSKTLVMRPFGVTQVCTGDINVLVSTQSRMTTGTCIFTPFVPYTRSSS